MYSAYLCLFYQCTCTSCVHVQYVRTCKVFFHCGTLHFCLVTVISINPVNAHCQCYSHPTHHHYYPLYPPLTPVYTTLPHHLLLSYLTYMWIYMMLMLIVVTHSLVDLHGTELPKLRYIFNFVQKDNTYKV